jgi:cytoskeletal protein RodZ
VFNLSGGLAVVGIAIFCAFASAEEQPWNRYGEEEEDEKNNGDNNADQSQNTNAPEELRARTSSTVNGHATPPAVSASESNEPSSSTAHGENNRSATTKDTSA